MLGGEVDTMLRVMALLVIYLDYY